MNADPIQCLYEAHDKQKNIHFLISGSTGTKYKVTITHGGKIYCSCPDYTNTSRDCICKHCLYVIYHVLELFRDVDHPFFKRCYFTPDEIHNVHSIYREILKRKKTGKSKNNEKHINSI